VIRSKKSRRRATAATADTDASRADDEDLHRRQAYLAKRR